MLFFLDSFPNQNQTSQCAFISLTPFTISSTYQFPKPDSVRLLPGYSWLITQKFSISHSCFSSFHPSSNFSLLGIILVFLPPNFKSQVSLSLFQLLVTICYLQLLFHNLIPCTPVPAQFHTNPPHSVVQATDG